MSRESFLNRVSGNGRSAAHKRSAKQEKELAKRGGGSRVPGSGSSYQKGDVKKFGGIYRVEAKTTSKKSFSITASMIEKITDAALPNGELPAIIVEFIDPDSGKPIHEVAVVPTYALLGDGS